MPDELVKRGYLTQSLGNALHSGEHGVENVPGLLRHVLNHYAWMKRIIVETGETFDGFPTFEEYVEAPAPKGLGSKMETLKNLVSLNPEARDLLDQILQNPRGNPTGNNQYTGGNGVNHPISSMKEKRDRSGKHLRRLRDQYPELHAQVLRGEKTVYAAAVEADIYPARVAINLKNPKSAASTILTWASPEFLEELRRLLTQ